jgi:dienelactone hydrolase
MTKFRTLHAVITSLAMLVAGSASAEIKKQWVDYAHGDAKLKAYMVYDDAITGKRPAILMIHAREGMTEVTQKHAETWAKLGYIIFAADIFGYGQGILPKTVPEMSAQTSIYTKDRAFGRARAMAGYETLLKQPNVDATKVAVLGFCFGGDLGTEFVSSGVPVAANITIHGSFRDREPGWAKDVKSRFLILHGAEDKGYPISKVVKVVDELRAQKKDFMVEVYSNTEHGFSSPKNKDEERAISQAVATSTRSLKEMFGG